MAFEAISLDDYYVRLTPTQLLQIEFRNLQLGFEKLKESNIYHDYSLSYLLDKLQDNHDPDNPEIELGTDGTSLTWKLIGKTIQQNLNSLPVDSVMITILPDPEYFDLSNLDKAFHKSGRYSFIGWIIQIVPKSCIHKLL